MKKRFIICLIVTAVSEVLFSQEHDMAKGKAELLSVADEEYAQERFPSAIKLYSKALRLDSTDSNALFMLANSHFKLNQTARAEYLYTSLEQLEDSLPAEFHLNFGETLLQEGKYKEAQKHLLKHYLLIPEDARSGSRLAAIERLDDFFLDTVSYNVTPMNFNSEASEISPAFFEDGFIYLSSEKKKSRFQTTDERTGDGFLKAYAYANTDSVLVESLRKSVRDLHQGPMVFFNNYKEAYSTENAKVRGTRGYVLKLFHLSWDKGGKHLSKDPLPFDVGGFSTGHPATNADGSILIFASDMPFGFGGTDLYISRKKDGRWTEPENLGSSINTSGNEVFPFLASTGHLYFSSDGHAGLGGLDVFRVDLTDREPVINLGAPVNSQKNDSGLILSEDDGYGYFVSNREGGIGKDDIYEFSIERAEVHAQLVNTVDEKTVPGTFNVINTRYGEKVPFRKDGNTISFYGLLNNNYLVRAKLDSINEVNGEIPITDLSNPLKKLNLSVDMGSLSRPVKVKANLVGEEDPLPSEGEASIIDLDGLKIVPFDVDEDEKIIFTGLTNRNYALVRNQSESGEADITKFSTHPRENEALGEIFQEIDIYLNQLNRTAISEGMISPPVTAPALQARTNEVPISKLITFDSGGHEQTFVYDGYHWEVFDKGTFVPKERKRIGPFYFDSGKAELRPEVKNELLNFYELVSGAPLPNLVVTGFADVVGSAFDNKILAGNRAESVRDFLVSLGYHRQKIRTIAFGEIEFFNSAYNILLGDRHQMSRRVSLTIEE